MALLLTLPRPSISIPRLHTLTAATSASLSSSSTSRRRMGRRAVARVGTGGGAATRTWGRMGSCLVAAPPAVRTPRAIVKFLGGAFVGAVPEVTYSHLMELLAKEGFLVVSVPYNVTFNHEQAARDVYERFHACMEDLFSSGVPHSDISAANLLGLPFYSVGHSNGALLQLLVGSYFCEKIPEANVVISFNNRPASEAVPYFEQLGPAVSQLSLIVDAFPLSSMARDASGDAWKALVNTAQTVMQNFDDEVMVSLNKFVDQIPSVMSQVTQGISEFKPTPSENHDFFKRSYNVPRTLLVKFNTDAIDETDLLEDILRPRVESIGGSVEKVVLSGNHLTPCIQDLKWQVGYQYTPADALAQSLKSLSLQDTRVLARTVADWLKGHAT